MSFISHYLSIGFGFYTGAALARFYTFDKASAWSIFKGFVLGLILWPVGIYLMIKFIRNQNDK